MTVTMLNMVLACLSGALLGCVVLKLRELVLTHDKGYLGYFWVAFDLLMAIIFMNIAFL